MSTTTVKRADGRTLRRTTFYVDEKLHKRLRLYCAEHNFDMSSVVADALNIHLDLRAGKGKR